jgi:hypothetical protein
VLLVILVIMLTEAVDAFECLFGKNAFVWYSEGVEEVL